MIKRINFDLILFGSLIIFFYLVGKSFIDLLKKLGFDTEKDNIIDKTVSGFYNLLSPKDNPVLLNVVWDTIGIENKNFFLDLIDKKFDFYNDDYDFILLNSWNPEFFKDKEVIKNMDKNLLGLFLIKKFKNVYNLVGDDLLKLLIMRCRQEQNPVYLINEFNNNFVSLKNFELIYL